MTKLCECGCGQPTSIAPKTSARSGHVKGQPLRFARGHRAPSTETAAQAIQRQIIIDIDTDCWVWQHGTFKDGYGKLTFKGKTHRAHRLAYTAFKEEIPADTLVCHKCDNPLCVNPEHLFLGTVQDNHDDMDSKGRRVVLRGEQKPTAKLTEADVAAIKGSAELGIDLAARYGVSPSTISLIRNNKRWQ